MSGIVLATSHSFSSFNSPNNCGQVVLSPYLADEGPETPELSNGQGHLMVSESWELAPGCLGPTPTC